MSIDWKKTSQGIEGKTTKELIKDNGQIETSHTAFDGILDGENITLTFKVKAPYTMTGTLKGDTLTLFPQMDLLPTTFKRVTRSERVEASRKLAERAAEYETKATPH